MGDTIVALPCFHKIVEQFPDFERIALTNIPESTKAAPLESILKNGKFIHKAIDYRLGIRDPIELFKLRRKLRATGADTLIYIGSFGTSRGLVSAYRDLMFFRACGFSRIVGIPLSRDLQRARVDPISGEEEYEAARLARCLSDLGKIELNDPAVWDLKLTPEEHSRAEEFLVPLKGAAFIGLNTGGKVAKKDWGEANWMALLSRLQQQSLSIGVVFVGGAEDSARATRLMAAWRGPALNGCGQLSPRETAAVLSRAKIFVGHDSGPMHFAAAVQTPCVGIFGSYNRPRTWYPFGPNHQVIHDRSGVENIEPGAVERAVQRSLQASLVRTLRAVT